MFETGSIVPKKFWFCIDHRDGSMWVYDVDGRSCWFVGFK